MVNRAYQSEKVPKKRSKESDKDDRSAKCLMDEDGEYQKQVSQTNIGQTRKS